MNELPLDLEPDPAFFSSLGIEPLPLPRALAVIVADHLPNAGKDTASLLTELLEEAGFTVDGVVNVAAARKEVRRAIDTGVIGGADLVITVGGTGVGARDITPEVTREVLDQEVPGVSQALRFSGLACGSVEAATSRGIAGISGQTVVVNIADSRAAIRDSMATLGPLVQHLIAELRKFAVAD
ncbi:MogA/MoaB family molybdenum cofactor biosynthesis protein [Corynebacterium caspium]|uniref:MogA/MoaB family molybdenum cofactor biosynthesis protein n=1 Tax=Corynebacterium caspium TaxID=234828 RepID=UPI0003676960|nr:molybdopterin-binding protein [Corynebacterium caspium]WKD59626.1 Molybdenum cofactor biosynthesis protein B [Corynebacterium caspium DSM 44850]